jgi:hypothetical protein
LAKEYRYRYYQKRNGKDVKQSFSVSCHATVISNPAGFLKN